MSGSKPSASKGSPDQKFVLKYEQGKEALVAANRRFNLTMSDGTVLEGKSDALGETDLLMPDAMHIADIDILKD